MSRSHSHSRGQPQASTSAQQPVPTTSHLSAPALPAHMGPSVCLSAKGEILADRQAIALDMVQMFATLMSNIADTFPIPGLKIGLLALAEVVKKIQIMEATVEGVVVLHQRIAALVASIGELLQQSCHPHLPPSMVSRINKLVGLWIGIAKRAREIKTRSTVIRFITSYSDAKRLADLVREINDSIQDNIVVDGILSIERYTHEIYKDVKTIRSSLQQTFMPRYAQMAPYYANEVRRSCLEGTRVDFLETIYARITAVCERGQDAADCRIVLWINGLGGTGKTTVARTVAEWCDTPRRRILGGSFFCSRADVDCSDPSLVFPTLCRQLCEHHQPFKDKVEEVLQRVPDITSFGLYQQFKELIVLPLEALDSPFPRSVFVLDALDELQDKGSQFTKSTILSVIATFAPRIAKFLLLVITSRPEADITALFEAKRGESLKGTTTPLLIHDIPIDTALKDIRLYIDHEFETNVAFRLIEPGWPSVEERNTLAVQSRGLYVFIATAIKFILDKAYLDPKGQMGLLASSMAKSSTPHKFLSTLYTTILVASYEKMSPELAGRLQDVLGTVVLAHEALSPMAVAQLVGLDAATVRSTLKGLHSVLHVPADDSEPIRIIHPTFPEFLLQSPEAASPDSPDTAPAPAHLRLQPAERHWYIFSRCVEVMSGALKRNMIGIRYPAMFQSEIDNLKQMVNAAVEPHVSYSCRFWGNHLRHGIKGAAKLDVSQSFHSFVHEQILYWIEACSWLDAMDKVILALDVAQEVCQTPDGRFTDLAPFLADCRRFVVTYSPCIHAAPLQLYHSALTIAPNASRVRSQYDHERKYSLVVEHGAFTDWAPCLDTIVTYAGTMLAVAFSPDGSCFVTGSSLGKVTIRRTATRTPVLSFDGHTDSASVRCVAFAPDGLHVASGGDDRKVCVWQASSGEGVHTLEGHTSGIFSVAYSGDGRRILSATQQGEVKLWDTADGRCLLTLDNTGHETCQIGLSTDGGIIARGRGPSVSLYDVASATSSALEFPDTVNACTYSPDGRHIAARSKHVIQVWAWPDRTLVSYIDVPDHLYALTARLAFSHDGTLIGCGSWEGSVCLWHIASGGLPWIMQVHPISLVVFDLAFSPDGSHVISVASDGMIRVWDRTLVLSTFPTAEDRYPILDSPPPPASGPPRFALIRSGDKPITLLHLSTLGVGTKQFALGAQSSDGAPTAVLFSEAVSACATALQTSNYQYDADSRAWASLITGQHHAQLSQHPFAVSLDGSLMAYPSQASHKTVNVCNLRTGAVVATLTECTVRACSIAFSPDNARIAIGSSNEPLNVWDTLTGALLYSYTEIPGVTLAIVFSPDGCLVASSSLERTNTVRVFEVSTERVVHKLESHGVYIKHVMFAADNTHLVTLDAIGCVCVWDITTGSPIREFSMHNHDDLRSPIFSPDGGGILISGKAGVTRTVTLWKPGTRTWPAYHVTFDGWVYAMSPWKRRRLCWLPQEWRTVLWFDDTKLYVGETKLAEYSRRRVIILDISQIVDYMDDLDASA